MYHNDINEYGCPLRDQSGSVAVLQFDAILARLAPELRAAFEDERALRQAELDRYFGAEGEGAMLQLVPADGLDPLAGAGDLLRNLPQVLGKIGWGLRELIASLFPRIIAR